MDDFTKVPMLEPFEVKECVSALSETEDYNHRMLGIPEMWKTTKGKGVKVVVLDTGCPQHIDIKVAGCRDFSGSQTPWDRNGHGSHVAGIIAALVNGIGVRGISPEVELYCGKVLGDDGSGSIDAIARGIYWAVDEIHADVVNMSLGCSPSGALSPSLRNACRYAYDHGVVLCCAAGNDAGMVNAPANLETTIAVAAVDRNREKAYFTCHGSEVDFAAGGVDVFSTWLNNQYAKLSGTSMATPVITGVVALVQAAAMAKGSVLTPDGVYASLVTIAVDVDKPGKDDYTGNGIPVFTSQWEEKKPESLEEPKKECWLVRLVKAVVYWFRKPEED